MFVVFWLFLINITSLIVQASGMHNVLQFWGGQFYTPIIEDVILLITLWLAYKYRRRFPILRYMPLYASLLLLSSLFATAGYLSKDLNFSPWFFARWDGCVDYFFTLAEMLICSHFYLQLIKSKNAKRIILVTNILFVGFFVYMGITDKSSTNGDISNETQSIVYTVESIMLLFPCLFYIVELFKSTPVSTLRNEPAFWVSTGILFFMSCTLPFSLLENYVAANLPTFFLASYSIFHVFYILLFLMIIRAYLCKPETAT